MSSAKLELLPKQKVPNDSDDALHVSAGADDLDTAFML